ncbi:MAG: SH3 domain-containing protein [Chloroflexi bacterium]|nr:SH3 domain-containing protein [Chloroflexota bacterium]
MLETPRVSRLAAFGILFSLFLHACLQVRLDPPVSVPTPRDLQSHEPEISLQIQDERPSVTPARVPSAGMTPTVTLLPEVTLTAVKGNIYIRRGPGMAFNPIDVMYENSQVTVIAHDMLSEWAQVVLPNSKGTGWVSLKTRYTTVNGDLAGLPGFTPTEWPVPAYLRNCTHHRMFILPGEIILPSYFGYPENEIWLYPGTYLVYDLDVPGEPEVQEVDIREGMSIDVNLDGAGERRICP